MLLCKLGVLCSVTLENLCSLCGIPCFFLILIITKNLITYVFLFTLAAGKLIYS